MKAAPRLDGEVGAKEWEASAGLQLDGYGAPKHPSEARLAWTPQGLLVAFSAQEPTPKYGGFEGNSSLHGGDLFEVFVDPEGDHRQYYEIQVDPGGRVQIFNHVLTSEPRTLKTLRFTRDFARRELWSYPIAAPASLKAVSKIDAKGRWHLELLIPAEMLGRRREIGRLEAREMRMNFCRVNVEGEGRYSVDVWAKVVPGCQHISPQAMGRVVLQR